MLCFCPGDVDEFGSSGCPAAQADFGSAHVEGIGHRSQRSLSSGSVDRAGIHRDDERTIMAATHPGARCTRLDSNGDSHLTILAECLAQ